VASGTKFTFPFPLESKTAEDRAVLASELLAEDLKTAGFDSTSA
jgi:hypothetical protein